MPNHLIHYTFAFLAIMDLTFSLDCESCIAFCDSASKGNYLEWTTCRNCLPSCGNLSKDLLSFFISNRCMSREMYHAYKQSSSDILQLLHNLESTHTKYDTCSKKLEKCQTVLNNNEFNITHIFESNRHRFFSTEQMKNESRELEEMARSRVPVVKTNGIFRRMEPTVPQFREACPTEYKIDMPKQAKHLSGYTVSLWLHKSYEQYFFIGKCKRDFPVQRMHPQGRCRVTQNMYKAMFLINQQMYEDRNAKFNNCRVAIAQLLYLCDDWVYLDSACSLFI